MLLDTFSEKDLTAEVEAIINARDSAIDTDWLAEEIMARHSDINGEDADFYILCARHYVKTAVRNVVRRYRLGPDEIIEAQEILPGFERLQRRYHIERGGRSLIVPIEEIGMSEMRTKIQEYESLMDGWRIHIAELRRYFFQRFNEHV